MKDSYAEIFGNKKRAMFVFAHPDDAEIYCGGTISRLVADGKKVRLVKMTTGNKGSRQEKVSEKELATIRETEDAEALKTLGLKAADSVNLDLGDGTVSNSLETIGKIVKEIRTFKPEILITHNPEQVLIRDNEGDYYVNHRDHRATGINAVDAAYPYSRDLLFYPEHIKQGLGGHSVTEFLFVDSWGHQDTIYIDVTDLITKRIQAIACHKSQYSQKDAETSTNYFAKKVGNKQFEQFRYVRAD